MNWLIACLMVVTGIVLYFPVVYIRKMNRVLKVLQDVEANTRGTVAAQRAAVGAR
jgi:hypothetical protein